MSFKEENFLAIIKDPLCARELYILHNLTVPEESESDLLSHITATVHRAFWDVIEDNLNDGDRKYESIHDLFTSVKKILLSLVSSNNYNLRNQIDIVINIDNLKIEVENNTFNTDGRVSGILDLMHKICAPIRDKEIDSLKKNKNSSIAFFRDVFKVLEHMKLDMCNFLLNYYRKEIITNSIALEQRLFESRMKKQYGYITHTKAWLQISLNKHSKEDLGNKNIINLAFLELLFMEPNSYPESFYLDCLRLIDISIKINSTIYSSAIYGILQRWISLVCVHEPYFSIKFNAFITSKFLKHPTANLKKSELQDISEQILSFLNSSLEKYSLEKICEKSHNSFNQQVANFSSQPNPVYELFKARVSHDVYSYIYSDYDLNSSRNYSFHFSLQVNETILMEVISLFARLISYNKRVHGDLYSEILTQLTSTPNP